MKLRMILKNLDDNNFKILYEEYKEAIFLFILSIVKNKSIAEELTQDTYIKIIKYHETYNSLYNPKTWIFQIAKNISYTYLKKQNEILIDNNLLNQLIECFFVK